MSGSRLALVRAFPWSRPRAAGYGRLRPGAGLILPLALLLAGCAAPSIAASAPEQATAFIETRVAQVLTETAPTDAPTEPPTPPPPTAGQPLEFATLTPIRTPLQVPTAGATVTPAATPAAPPTPGTPCPDAACAQAAQHFILERPAPPEAAQYVDRTYGYGSTQQGLREPHHGVEIVNRSGTPVLAAGAGTVVAAGPDDQIAFGPATHFYGNLVVVELEQAYHGQPVYTLYGHLARVDVTAGQSVQAGDVLGTVGQTGVAIGPHLHFEVRVGQNSYAHTRNPELWLKPLPDVKGRPYGALAGRIVDLEGNLLYGQTVVIRPVDVNEATRTKYITTYAQETLNGDDILQENFSLGDLPAGRYSVAVNTTKFYEQTIVIEPGQLGWVTFTVKPPAP
ncbi:MAG: M23 family metallopeptidase [Anaerolineales bacterium]|nr:M23 family metallopeptidase [Anaerolineales bacterium]